MKRFRATLAAGLVSAFVPAVGHAQGFGLYEHGSCTMGRAGAAVAKPCPDGSAIMFNPAGLTALGGGWVASGGLTLIAATGGFQDDYTGTGFNLKNPPIPVPHGYVAYGITDKLAAGIGVFVPYGLGSRWDSLTFDGRFNGYDNDLRAFYIQPTVSYRVHPRVSVGAGFDFVLSSVKLKQFLDLSEFGVPGQPITFGQLGIPFHTGFAKAEINATNATGFGGHFGVMADVTNKLHFGARYLMQVKVNYSGTANFEPVATGLTLAPGNPLAVALGLPTTLPTDLDLVLAGANLFSSGGPLADQGGKATIMMPWQIAVGLAYDVSDRLTVLADYQFVHWSSFQSLTLDFETAATPDEVLVENFKNTHGVRLGFDYAINDQWTVRGGYLYHTGAAPPETVTPILPEGTRNEFTLGLGFDLLSNLHADVAYQYLRQNHRRGRVVGPPSGQPGTLAMNSGVYIFNGNLAAATFTVRF